LLPYFPLLESIHTTMSLPSPTTNRSGVPMQMDPKELEAMDVSGDGDCVLLLLALLSKSLEAPI
jgi:hypothetical protein